MANRQSQCEWEFISIWREACGYLWANLGHYTWASHCKHTHTHTLDSTHNKIIIFFGCITRCLVVVVVVAWADWRMSCLENELLGEWARQRMTKEWPENGQRITVELCAVSSACVWQQQQQQQAIITVICLHLFVSGPRGSRCVSSLGFIGLHHLFVIDGTSTATTATTTADDNNGIVRRSRACLLWREILCLKSVV